MVQKAKKSSNPKSKAKKVQKVEKVVEPVEPVQVTEDIVAPAPEVSETPYADQFSELITRIIHTVVD